MHGRLIEHLALSVLSDQGSVQHLAGQRHVLLVAQIGAPGRGQARGVAKSCLHCQSWLCASTAFAGGPAPARRWPEAGSRAGLGVPVGPNVSTGNGLDFLAGRVSYAFNLAGPCLATHTACSSSLVATHLAAQGLREGDCAAALPAGVFMILLAGTMAGISQLQARLRPPAAGRLLDLKACLPACFACCLGVSADLWPVGAARQSACSAGAAVAGSDLHAALQAFSPVGRCKTFDASADGYGRGEGCAALVLRCEASGSSGSPPLAVLRGSLVNQDGRSSSLTAPNGPSQTALISTTIQNAGAAPGWRL